MTDNLNSEEIIYVVRIIFVKAGARLFFVSI